ncbi:MAG: zinc-ribbon domain-containing protein, partial [Flavobacteriaceae bacterium]
MKVFQCSYCNNPLFFENNKCENCGHLSGYSDFDQKMQTFDPSGYSLISDIGQLEYKYCKNGQYGVCNWLLPKNSHQDFCHACQFNRTIANLSVDQNFQNWQHLEVAKHRLIYQIQKL